MKLLFTALALGLSGLSLAQVPFYFAVPVDSMLKTGDRNFVKIPIKKIDTSKAFLKGFIVNDPHELTKDPVTKEPRVALSPSSVVAAKKLARAAIAQSLYKRGLLKTGDIVLSFRPSWEKTTPYSHIQMGVSHAGLIYVENNVLKNLDMPLDTDHSGPGLNSSLDSKHYLEADSLHIIRPRSLSPEQQKNLLSWIQLTKSNGLRIRQEGLLSFNKDYTAPKFNNYGPSDDAFVTTLGKILTRQDRSSKDLTLYCSEFTWALLSLTNCSPDDIRQETSADAVCVSQYFSPMPVVTDGNLLGLGEGPLSVLESLDIPLSQKVELLKDLFYDGRVDLLSSGHRALAVNPMIQQLVGILQLMYPTKLSGKGTIDFPAPRTPISAASLAINANGKRNYSPTAFLINTMLDNSHSDRKFDYVGTIIFTAP